MSEKLEPISLEGKGKLFTIVALVLLTGSGPKSKFPSQSSKVLSFLLSLSTS